MSAKGIVGLVMESLPTAIPPAGAPPVVPNTAMRSQQQPWARHKQKRLAPGTPRARSMGPMQKGNPNF